MNGIECPECGAADVSTGANSCPECGYPIVGLSGFSIRERLREAAPDSASLKVNQSKPVGRAKNQIKAKLFRAKTALAKKGKRKPAAAEPTIPKLDDRPIFPVKDVEDLDKTAVFLPSNGKNHNQHPTIPEEPIAGAVLLNQSSEVPDLETSPEPSGELNPETSAETGYEPPEIFEPTSILNLSMRPIPTTQTEVEPKEIEIPPAPTVPVSEEILETPKETTVSDAVSEFASPSEPEARAKVEENISPVEIFERLESES